jgi:hypothetical protein
MRPKKIFPAIWTKFCTSNKENKTLPSYDEASKTPQAPKELKRIASKIPQWKWSTLECREWLRAVHVVYFNFGLDEAAAGANKFEGCGSSLYMKSIIGWLNLFGERGAGIYGILLALRHKRGAVPSIINLSSNVLPL